MTMTSTFPTSVFADVTNPDECPDPSYIPTVAEFFEALGPYGWVFLAVGIITTVVLFGLFFQQMWFTFSYAHKAYRRHIYWLISIYPVMALMSTLTLVVPRSYRVCNAVKITYMSVGIGHFADLTIMMHGSENKMLEDLRDSPMHFDLLPFCCCCKCLPTPPITKIRLSLTKWMIWQMKWTQGLYYIVFNVWITGLQNQEGQVDPGTSFLGLTIFNFASFLSGVWALNIMDVLCRDKLERFRYRQKSLAIKLLILTTKLQNFVFAVMGNNDVFPCLSPLLTPIGFQIGLEFIIYIVEMLLFGLYSYFMYRRREFEHYNDPAVLKFNLAAEEELMSKKVSIYKPGNYPTPTFASNYRENTICSDCRKPVPFLAEPQTFVSNGTSISRSIYTAKATLTKEVQQINPVVVHNQDNKTGNNSIPFSSGKDGSEVEHFAESPEIRSETPTQESGQESTVVNLDDFINEDEREIMV